eukprot:8590643-Ditylum_brightwellii.AAC.1
MTSNEEYVIKKHLNNCPSSPHIVTDKEHILSHSHSLYTIQEVENTTSRSPSAFPSKANKSQSKENEKENEETKHLHNDVEVTKSFDDMILPAALLCGIYAFGFEKLSAIQQLGIKPTISEQDSIAQAQSGTGKTTIFAIRALAKLNPNMNR